MVKQTRKILSTTILLILLSSIAYTTLTPSVHAAEVSAADKGLSILNNVVGLDTAKYTVALKNQQNQTDPNLGVPKEYVGYNFTSEGSKLQMLCTFANGNLQMINVFKNEGQPNLNKQAATGNAVQLAQGFLSSYQTHTKNALFGQLKSTLENVDTSKNLTKTSGNAQLEVSSINGYVMFKWTYAFNGIIAPAKFVALGFNNSFLTYFVDNWQFYKIGTTTATLSESEAKNIALNTAKSYSWSVNLDEDAFDPKNFNDSNVRWATLFFDNSLDASKPRNEDTLMLYPVWSVGVALNRWYDHLYGLEVDVWADTKETKQIQEAWATITPQEEKNLLDALQSRTASNASNLDAFNTTLNSQIANTDPNLAMWVAASIIAIALTGATSASIIKKKQLRLYNLPKLRKLKTGGTLLCILMLSVLASESIATVNASGGAVVWGSESTGAGAYPNSWRKNSTEIELQRVVSSTIRSYFATNGYGTAWNHQGNYGSSKSQILSDISALQNSYNWVAVVDFDHGVGRTDYQAAPPGEFHYMFEDNAGTVWSPQSSPQPHPQNGVYDMDIYPLIQSGNKIKFALINTCLSADITIYGQGELPPQFPYPGRARGMPFAWTRRLIGSQMSSDGYNNPDYSGQCYIGFPWGSASLMQKIPHPSGTVQYRWWVTYFFYYALNFDMSVNDALNTVCSQYWGQPFGNSPLHASTGGFTAYWWNANPETMSGSSMAVYGDGTIHLRNP